MEAVMKLSVRVEGPTKKIWLRCVLLFFDQIFRFEDKNSFVNNRRPLETKPTAGNLTLQP